MPPKPQICRHKFLRAGNSSRPMPLWTLPNLDLFASATLQVIDNIGNLLAISFRANSSLGNLSPAKKIHRLNGEVANKIQNLSYVRDFIEKYGGSAASGDEAKINNRAQEMANDAYERVWKIC